jgi:hypothetical protein
MIKINFLLLFSLFLSLCLPNEIKAGEKGKCNVLTKKEKAEGWQLLFDGKSLDQFRGYNGKEVSKSWTIEDGCLKSIGKAGADLVAMKDYENFQLKFEWRSSKGANSGIFYDVIEDPKYKRLSETGPEYQIIDDEGFPEKLLESQLAGANYEMHVADKSKKTLYSVESGKFNSGMIVVNKNHIEHWLNGKKILEFERWTDDWYKRKNEAKWKDYPGYGTAKSGKIGIQDHGSIVWLRNIKIREL